MNIAVVGMGLIGGSFCKTIKKNTGHQVWGIDKNGETTEAALKDGSVDRIIDVGELCKCDIAIVALHPQQTIDFILENAFFFKKGSIVMDVCGVKKSITDAVEEKLAAQSVRFVPTHPMAGREYSGYGYSLDTMFDNASFIIAKTNNTDPLAIQTVEDLAREMEFKRIVISDPELHDRVIAFTSQLAHVLSNAYIKSPTLHERSGYSAGSFLDMTRVAKLNEDMWTTLFMMNKDPLMFEIDTIIEHLTQYRDAIAEGNDNRLKELLREGRIIKENSLESGDR